MKRCSKLLYREAFRSSENSWRLNNEESLSWNVFSNTRKPTVFAKGDLPPSVTYICDASMATCSKNLSITQYSIVFLAFLRQLSIFWWTFLQHTTIDCFPRDFFQNELFSPFHALDNLFIEFLLFEISYISDHEKWKCCGKREKTYW